MWFPHGLREEVCLLLPCDIILPWYTMHTENGWHFGIRFRVAFCLLYTNLWLFGQMQSAVSGALTQVKMIKPTQPM